MGELGGQRVLLGVSGGIAAYKAADLVRRLQDAGAEVRVVMTEGAQQFVSATTFQALSTGSSQSSRPSAPKRRWATSNWRAGRRRS